MLARRIAEVDGDAAMLLDVVAIAGDACTPAALDATSLPEERLLDATRALEDADLLVPTPRGPAFAHGLLRDVAHARLERQRVHDLHREVATALDRADAPASERAHHWDRGEEWLRAWPLYRRAAEEALAGHAVDEAERCLRRALELPVDTDEASVVREDLVDRVLVPTGRVRAAREVLAPWIDGELSCRALLAWVDVLQLQGEYAPVDGVLDRAVAAAGDDQEQLARAWTLRAEHAHRLGRSEQARHAAKEALAAAERAPGTDKVLASWYTAASVFRAAGATTEALAAADRLLDQGRRNGSLRMEAFGLELRGLLALDRGDAQVVVDSLSVAAARFRQVRDRRHEALCLGNLAGACYLRAELLVDAVDALHALGDLRSAALYTQNLGSVHELREAWSAARAAYREAAEELIGLGDAEAAACLAAGARVERRDGAPREAAAAMLDRAEAMELDRTNQLAVALERAAFAATYDGDGHAALAAAEAMIAELEAVPSFLEGPVEEARGLVRGTTGTMGDADPVERA
ncbi:MAG: hypothetical protein H6738_09110 [Alphaproteobacteria bacterium]|nr:hypothetical protein [Alphaproteobacteria bacterium]MCB9696921.1 hypothetical protein [Alphaproteobacteria bacterium]